MLDNNCNATRRRAERREGLISTEIAALFDVDIFYDIDKRFELRFKGG
jgi:hypothetical protein